MALNGYVITHRKDGKDWRLRRFRDASDNHPIDPNWETGRYMRCHKKARDGIESGSTVFDVVILDKRPVIRSAFEIVRGIKRGTNRTLYFRRFLYPSGPGSSLAAPIRAWRTNYPIRLPEGEAESLLSRMHGLGYVEYEAGEIPKGINPNDWRSMTGEARRALRKPHSCP